MFPGITSIKIICPVFSFPCWLIPFLKKRNQQSVVVPWLLVSLACTNVPRTIQFAGGWNINRNFPCRFAELCDLDCGPHGHCVDNACDCLPGWSGELCNLKQCDPRCNEHGQCKNGTCLCVTGWNGKHCTMEGCPNSCSGHGQCRVSNDGQWECRCYDGWDGKDCNVLLEQNCNDGRDNDKGIKRICNFVTLALNDFKKMKITYK